MPPFERSEHRPFKEPASPFGPLCQKRPQGLWMKDWKGLGFKIMKGVDRPGGTR